MLYNQFDSERIGKAIKELRTGENETMEELANAIGTSHSAIAMYESGRRVPRDEIKIRIAEHFHKTVESIFFAKGQHESCD